MQGTIEYIIKFLIGTEQTGSLYGKIGYTSDRNLFEKYSVVIIPSGFFDSGIYGTASSIPSFPLEYVDGVPLLFGSNRKEWYDGTLLIYADIIASSYFLMTRYEEIVKRNIRDIHGRFPGKESTPYKGNFLNRPIIEEYGSLLRNWLREVYSDKEIKEPEKGFQKIWLTHDVDAPFFCKSIRNLLRETIKGCGLKNAWRMYRDKYENDPYFTFPWFTEQEKELKKKKGELCQTIYFIKGGGNSKADKPFYYKSSKSISKVCEICGADNNILGLHTSYSSSINPANITKEKYNLEKICGKEITFNRHHFLCCREPEDLDELEKAGITDDFTMGYADVNGFRLGTCRPVRWINPLTKRLSDLVLHPLTCMDVTFSEKSYMAMSETEAIEYCINIVKSIYEHNGEVVLLWHNENVSDFMTKGNFNHRHVYKTILETLSNL